MSNELDNIIVLNDENGISLNFEFLDLIEYEKNEYVVLLPVDESDEAGKVVILQVEDENGEEDAYVSVEDDNTLLAVFEMFKEKYKDKFNFVDWYIIIYWEVMKIGIKAISGIITDSLCFQSPDTNSDGIFSRIWNGIE